MQYYGGTASSKLFQNVREKASLAYSANSNYIKQKNNIYIQCGIDINNYQKAVEIINKQLEDIKNGNISEEEIKIAKQNITSAINTIQEEQDTQIIYYLGQELSGKEQTYEEYLNNVQKVSKEQIKDIANKIQINTIYFLRN